MQLCVAHCYTVYDTGSSESTGVTSSTPLEECPRWKKSKVRDAGEERSSWWLETGRRLQWVKSVESQRGWRMPDFPCQELHLILNEMGQDLIYLIKWWYSFLWGECIGIEERIKAGSLSRVIKVVQARIRMTAVETKGMGKCGDILWRQEIGLIGRLDVQV